jgi:uncharacterized protein YndB with AHSA1/START domain
MTAKQIVTAEKKELELILSRVFDAPRKLVYQMLTEPKHVTQWWGPHSMSNPICEIDLRIGGAYLFVMRGPDGVDYPMKGVYKEIIPNERVAFTADLEGHPKFWHDMLNDKVKQEQQEIPSKFISLITISLEDYEGKTKFTVTTEFTSDAVRNSFAGMGMVEGWTESLEKLETLLVTK